MADEEIKKTTPKKRTTTTKTKVEEETKHDLMLEQMQQQQLQMQQMMAMMMAQQQQFMEFMQNTQQTQQQVVQVKEEYKEQSEEQQTDEQQLHEKQYTPKLLPKKDRLNKQKLRQKYKDAEIYVTNVTQGIVIYHGRNMRYEWQNPGDNEVMTINDVINMPRAYLYTPWVAFDAYENDSDMLDDIVNALGLDAVYEYIYTLQEMEEDINDVDLEDIKRAIELSRKHGYDITMDMTVLIQRKIRENVLTNYHTIAELSKLLGRKFL